MPKKIIISEVHRLEHKCVGNKKKIKFDNLYLQGEWKNPQKVLLWNMKSCLCKAVLINFEPNGHKNKMAFRKYSSYPSLRIWFLAPRGLPFNIIFKC